MTMVIVGIALMIVAALVHFAVMSVQAALFTVGGVLLLIGILEGGFVVPRR